MQQQRNASLRTQIGLRSAPFNSAAVKSSLNSWRFRVARTRCKNPNLSHGATVSQPEPFSEHGWDRRIPQELQAISFQSRSYSTSQTGPSSQEKRRSHWASNPQHVVNYDSILVHTFSLPRHRMNNDIQQLHMLRR